MRFFKHPQRQVIKLRLIPYNKENIVLESKALETLKEKILNIF